MTDSWGRVLFNRVRILLIYVIFGPLIGAILFSSFLAVLLMPSGLLGPTEPGWGNAAKDALRLLRYIALNGYWFGGLQAALAGLIICLFADRAGRFGYRVAFWASLPPSILGGVIFESFDGPNSFTITASFAALGVASSLFIRLMFGKIFRPKQLS